MMKRIIAMPGKLMFDGKDSDLFDHFATVCRGRDLYGSGLRADHGTLIKTWGGGEGGHREGGRAQEYPCGLPKYCEGLAEKMAEGLAKQPKYPLAGFTIAA
jgi:acyl-[acyl-carrier-protein] desaturase